MVADDVKNAIVQQGVYKGRKVTSMSDEEVKKVYQTDFGKRQLQSFLRKNSLEQGQNKGDALEKCKAYFRHDGSAKAGFTADERAEHARQKVENGTNNIVNDNNAYYDQVEGSDVMKTLNLTNDRKDICTFHPKKGAIQFHMTDKGTKSSLEKAFDEVEPFDSSTSKKSKATLLKNQMILWGFTLDPRCGTGTRRSTDIHGNTEEDGDPNWAHRRQVFYHTSLVNHSTDFSDFFYVGKLR